MTESPAFKRFVVGIDGSEDAARALEVAIRLARATGAEIVAVYAVESSVRQTHAGLYGRRLVPPGHGRVTPVDQFVHRWCRPLALAGVPYRTIVQAGSPALVIEAVADSLDADLVVVGRRGLGSIAGLVLGSVSEHLTHIARRPVLLVSRPPEAGSEYAAGTPATQSAPAGR